MGLRATVKVGNITNLSDARSCAGMGVELLGFNINPESDDYVNPETFHAIKGWIEGVKYVMEYDGTGQPDYSNYEFDFLEVSNLSVLDKIDLDPSKIILRKNAETSGLNNTLEKLKNSVSFFDFYSNSNSITDEVNSCLHNYPAFIGYGFDRSNINEILDQFPSTGISLKGTKEIKPGYKDYDELADILEEIEEDY